MVVHFIPAFIHFFEYMPESALTLVQVFRNGVIFAVPNKEPLSLLILNGIICVGLEWQLFGCFAVDYVSPVDGRHLGRDKLNKIEKGDKSYLARLDKI